MAKSVDAADLKSASLHGSAGSSPAVRTILIAAFALPLAACGQADDGPLTVSIIGAAPTLRDPNQRPLGPADEVLVAATRQGLLGFDESANIEPGLAARWIVTDDGLAILFRLSRDARWPDGRPVTAHQVARRLRASLARGSRNPLKPLLGVVTRVQSTTNEVLEVQLAAPRANLLPLFAQPQLGIPRGNEGAGPYRVVQRLAGRLTLERTLTPPEESEEPARERLHLRGESATLALARFRRGLGDVVLGGTLGDLPVARAAEIAGPRLRFDPALGLFGLLPTGTDGPLAEPAARDALSMAIDRDALVAALEVPGLAPRATVLPPVDGQAIGLPGWAGLPLAQRRADAARLLAGAAEGDAPVSIRVAMPEGSGYRLLFALLDRDWRAVGVQATPVGPSEPADLSLVDRVAPSPALAWYLEPFSCPVAPICVPEVETALAASRVERDARLRRAQQVEAANRIAAEALFIPLAAPIRWNAVGPRATGFRVNPLARHPLHHLRDGERR